MQNFDLENIKSNPSLSLAKAKASRDLQINFNQAEDPLTISTKSRGDNKSGSATQSGRSMIEMLGVLAIIGVLSVGGIAGYSKAMHKYRVNKAIEQITLIAGNVRSFFAPQRNYEGLGSCIETNSGRANCKLIKKAKLMPDEMWDDTDKQFKNVFGYRVYLDTADKSTSGDKQAFIINYHIGHTGESLEACIELITHDWTAANASFINLGGPTGSFFLKLPVDLDKAVDVCSTSIKKHQESSYYGALYPALIFYFDVNLNGDAWKNTNWAN